MENIRSLLGERQLALDSDELKSLTLIGQRLATGVEQSEDAVVGAISQGTQELLSGIRQVAEQRLNHIMTRKREAERLVAQYGNPRATQLYDEWLNIKGIGGNTSIERHKILEELFPSGNLDEANANWLVLIKERFGGIAPPPTRRGIPKRYEKCFLPSVGGLVGPDDITSISVPGLAACCILYMVDSLSNVSTALELSEQCIQPTDDPRVQRVQSIKPRAGYEAIITDFQVNDSSVLISVPQAIHFIKDHTGSDEVRCSGCLFFLTDETRRAHWKDAEQKIEAGLRKEINLAPLMRERLEKHLRKLQGFSSQAFVQRGRENE